MGFLIMFGFLTVGTILMVLGIRMIVTDFLEDSGWGIGGLLFGMLIILLSWACLFSGLILIQKLL